MLQGVSVREEEKCKSFQESLKNDMAATRHAGQLDMVEIDNFISRLVDCEGQLFVSGVGGCAPMCSVSVCLMCLYL